jgi:hypothetical protein
VVKDRAELKARSLRDLVYLPYLKLVYLLNFSSSWANDVAIPNINQEWVRQREYQAADHSMPGANLNDRLTRFLKWIVRVVEPGGPTNPDDIDTENLLLLALRLINPRTQCLHAQLQHPENKHPDLTEGEFEAKFDAIMKRVVSYCQDRENATDLQNTFFGGNNNASNFEPVTRYEEWYKNFNSVE